MSEGPTSATYLYCLVRPAPGGTLEEALEGAPEGVPGASRLRIVPVDGDVSVIATDVPLPAYGQAEIDARLQDLDWVSDRALGHEAVVGHLAGSGAVAAVLPMKLFTLFADEGRAVEHLRRDLPRTRELLDRVTGRLEWGVRVHHDPQRAAETVDAAPAEAASGRDFLVRKRRLRDAARRAPEAAAAAAEEAFGRLASRVAESRRRSVEGRGQLLLDAAFLVPREERETFLAEVDAAARSLADAACELTLTGPWPPYNFVGEAR